MHSYHQMRESRPRTQVHEINTFEDQLRAPPLFAF